MYREKIKLLQIPYLVFIGNKPPADQYTPNTPVDHPYVELEPAEVEALHLVDMLGYSQEEAGEMMVVSRGTIWWLLQEARKRRLKPSQRGEGSEFCPTTKKADQRVDPRTLLTA